MIMALSCFAGLGVSSSAAKDKANKVWVVTEKREYNNKKGKLSIKTTYKYDSNGNMTKKLKKRPNGTWAKYSYKYDSNGNLIKGFCKTSSGDWQKYAYKYDSNGNLIKKSRNESEGSNWYEYTYKYDSNGNLINESYKKPNGRLGEYVNKYDSNGNIIKINFESSKGRRGEYTYKYDSSGNAIRLSFKRTDGYWFKWGAKYDSKGNMIKDYYKESDGYWDECTYKYDSKGNMIKKFIKQLDNGIWNEYIYKYDLNGNRIKETYRSSYGNNFTTNYAYKLIDISSSEETCYAFKFKLGRSTYTYDGKEKYPAVIPANNSLVLGLDYTVSYSNNVKIGKGTVTIKLMGDYNGTIQKTFKIVPGKVSGTKSKKSGNSSVITWNKVAGATGYQVYQCNSKTEKYEKIGTTKSNTLKKKYKGKEAKIKIRAYCAKGETVYYGAYSTAKKVKI